MKELYLAALQKDDGVRSATKGHVKQWMFSNEVAQHVFSTLHNLSFYSDAAVEAELCSKISRKEVDTVLGLLNRIQVPLIGSELTSVLETYEVFVREKRLASLVRDVNNTGYDDEHVLKSISDIQSVGFSTGKIYNFTDLKDIDQARSMAFPEGCDKVIKSSFSLINNSLQMGGYTSGTLSMFVGKPGGGKTTMMICEGLAAAIQGYRVFHMFLGDMGPYDALCKYISCRKKIPLGELATYGVEKHIDDDMRMILERVRFSVHGSYQLSVDGVASISKKIYRDWPFQMMIVDYDGNIIPDAGDSLYESGGHTYGKLESLCRELKLPLLIGSQAKIHMWPEEILPMESAADSSKKQHAVDMMVTLGRSHRVAPIGTINIAKMRRGEVNQQSRVKINGSTSSIREITEDEYQEIKNKFDNPDPRFSKDSK